MKYNILIAESYSCQRDLILNLIESSLRPYLKIYACHRQWRSDILDVADESFLAPQHDPIPFILKFCLEHKISLVFCGKNTSIFEQQRALFEQQGIILITGATQPESIEQISNKALFTEMCEQQHLPVTPAVAAYNYAELQHGITEMQQRFPEQDVCVKPIYGVYAEGFFCLKQDAELFTQYKYPFVTTLQQFCEAYAALAVPIPYLVMPFLAGEECSVDISCSQGQVLAHATRIKRTGYQDITVDGPCDDICQRLVTLFQLDGLINIQLKQNDQQQWFILEINSRPAGGFAYSRPTGLNLIAELISHKLNLPFQRQIDQPNISVRPITTVIEGK